MIDGTALLSLIERALEILIPIVGHRMKFLKKLEELKAGNTNIVVGEISMDSHIYLCAIAVSVVDLLCKLVMLPFTSISFEWHTRNQAAH